MDWKLFLFSFDGRVSRKQFWLFNIAQFGLFVILKIVLTGKIDFTHRDLFSIIYLVIFLWPMLAIQTKRWHDRNKPGTWGFINGVPFGTLWSIVELGFLEGTVGENRFGRDPLEGVQRRYNFSREFTWTQNLWAFGFLFLIFFFILAWAIAQVFIK
jgi:uncharacterized membrane protein YhaH (DUF805 family)